MNVLMAWELGAGLGHTIPLAAIGNCLEDSGHSVHYALRNTDIARIAGIRDSSRVVSAPAMIVNRNHRGAAYDCADMLLIRGYENNQKLDRVVASWMNIFERFSIEQLVADHSPTARLAAYVAGIDSHAIGNGFAIPPLTKPLRPFRDAQWPHPEKQVNLERRLNLAVNEFLKRHGVPEVVRAVDIFYGGSSFLLTFEELDNYSGRGEAKYFGPPYVKERMSPPEWPGSSTPTQKAFVYLYPDAAALPKILASLEKLEVSTLVYLPTQHQAKFRQFVNPKMMFTDQPFGLYAPAAECNLMICQGGGNTMATALLQGIPVMSFPRHIEARMSSERLQVLGLGLVMPGNVDEVTIRHKISKCLEDNEMKSTARSFAKKYSSFNGSAVGKVVAEKIINSYRSNHS